MQDESPNPNAPDLTATLGLLEDLLEVRHRELTDLRGGQRLPPGLVPPRLTERVSDVLSTQFHQAPALTPATPHQSSPQSASTMNAEPAIAKTYDPHAIEQARYRQWEQAGYFAAQGRDTPYCIMLPPPNVTGSLHMGHAFQDTLMDALIRYHRMQGFRTLWQCGTDHAGIATQMVVERQLAQKGQSRQALGRRQGK